MCLSPFPPLLGHILQSYLVFDCVSRYLAGPFDILPMQKAFILRRGLRVLAMSNVS